MTDSTAHVATVHASRYLQQLAKHWSHSLRVEFTANRAAVVFPKDVRGADWLGDATFTMDAHSDCLRCRIEASAEDQLLGLKGVVERHLNRFAFREAPLTFSWDDQGSGGAGASS